MNNNFSLQSIHGVPLSEENLKNIGDPQLAIMETNAREDQVATCGGALTCIGLSVALGAVLIHEFQTGAAYKENIFIPSAFFGSFLVQAIKYTMEYIDELGTVTKVQQARAIVTDNIDMVKSETGKAELVEAGYFVQQADSNGATYTRVETHKPS